MCFRMCFLTSAITTFVQTFLWFTGKKRKAKNEKGEKVRYEKNDYLGRLGKLLTVLLLNLLQPAVGLQQKARRESVRKRYADRWIERHKERDTHTEREREVKLNILLGSAQRQTTLPSHPCVHLPHTYTHSG